MKKIENSIEELEKFLLWKFIKYKDDVIKWKICLFDLILFNDKLIIL